MGTVAPELNGLTRDLEAIGKTVAFGAGDLVIAEGEPGKGIYILRSGSARVSMVSHEGKTIQLRSLEPGAFIGLSSALTCDHCCYSVESGGASEFTFVPVQQTQELLKSRPELCLEVIRLLGQEMAALCNERALLSASAKPMRIQT